MSKFKESISEVRISENFLITPTFVFFIIVSMQIGVGILGFQKYVAQSAGFDSWISILIAGGAIHILLWMVYHILEDGGGDIVAVHRNIFGKYFGGFLSIVSSFYFLLLSLTVLRTFIEVVQIWIFPRLQLSIFTLVFILLIYYMLTGGFRLITGLCLISVILTIPLLAFKIFPIQEGFVTSLYPVINHSIPELLVSARQSVLSFLGFELLLVFYPFIKDPKASKKWAHFGVFYVILVYLASLLVAFIYYSEEQLQQVTWATISTWKIVEFPFFERFEYIGIALWVYAVIPNICLGLWAASRIPKRLFKFKQKYTAWVFCGFLYIATLLLNDRQLIEQLNVTTEKIGLYVLLYIPILFILTKILKKVRN
ncbi:GerAB/ArcD/ProY family transporter [Halobacillus seohaensis]|uniref:GerAB/ArcD/ProY family transporter n=1 Tax=Halobacillus seohaensis TaxID=447421 RepID=A0ABW2EKI5_9BACI